MPSNHQIYPDSKMPNAPNSQFATLYSAKAHVFYLNPETNNSWLPKAGQAIPVSLIATSVGKGSPQSKSHNPPAFSHEFKLVGTNDRGELVLNDVITSATEFKKRSLKFCQWLDQNNSLMGLGFDEEDELETFIKRFEELKEGMTPPGESRVVKRSPSAIQQTDQDDRTSTISGANAIHHANSQLHHHPTSRPETGNSHNQLAGHHMSTRHQQHPPTLQYQNDVPTSALHHVNNGMNDAMHLNNGISADHPDGLASSSSTRYSRSQSMFALGKENNGNDIGKVSPHDADNTNWNEQLRYDNEKLKQLNEKNKQNSAIWASELSILRTNNHKLTQALQESKSHVAGWERELMNLREENKELKVRMAQFESQSEMQKDLGHKKDLQEFKAYIEEMQRQMRDKDKEIESLQNSMSDLELNLKNARNNNDDLAIDKHAVSFQQVQKLEQFSAKFDAIINELRGAKKDLTKIVADMTPLKE